MSELISNSTRPIDTPTRQYTAGGSGATGTAVADPGAKAGAEADGRESGFRLDVQGLRAIAVSMVVIYHLRPSLLPGGFAGAEDFFVTSP